MAVLGLLAVAGFAPLGARAATLTSRSVTLGSSAASASTTYDFKFNPGQTAGVGSIKLQVCTSPLELTACTASNSSSLSGASFSTSSPTTAPFTSNWAAGSGGLAATATTFYVVRSSGTDSLSTATSYTIRLTGVTNPNVANTQFYARIYTYSGTDGSTGPLDFGAMALSTAAQITVSGTMPESLVFCVGTSGTDCGNITGTSVDLGTFSPTATNTGTSVMSASTNAGSGYVITINGTTLTSGSNTITAMGTQSANSSGCSPSCTSTTGTSQFGTNVRDNATPNVGTDVSGSGTATGFGGYNTADSFRFFTGDTVASVGVPTQSNLFTNTYIVNVGGNQAAGVYSATLTYICTATF